jgi:hypothetical protein
MVPSTIRATLRLSRQRGWQIKAARRRRPSHQLGSAFRSESETLFSIPPSVDAKLQGLDSGKCLITRLGNPAASIQVAHLFGRKACIPSGDPAFRKYQDGLESLLRRCDVMWNVPFINIHSTENLVTCTFSFLTNCSHSSLYSKV